MKKLLLLLFMSVSLVVSAQSQPEVKELTIQGSRPIYGMLASPRVEKPAGIVIISHGFNGTHDYEMDFFEPLAALGYYVYAFDFPCGSFLSRSDANTMNMSILDEVNDLKSIIRYFKAQPYIDPSRIMLIGESQGGLVSALAAAQMKKDIQKMVLLYPAFCIPDNWRTRYPRVEDIREVTEIWSVKLGRRYFEEVCDMYPLKLINKYRGPVLIVQGDKDAIVSMEDSKQAVKLYKKARLHVIPGAGHGFNPVERAEAIHEIETFLK